MLGILQYNQDKVLPFYTSILKRLFIFSVLMIVGSSMSLHAQCDNLTDGGKIDSYEISGGPFTSSRIESAFNPSGGSGQIEYRWLQSTDPNLPKEHWTIINGATSSTYEPGQINTTTYFQRDSKREDCAEWTGESNIITKIINGAIEICKEDEQESENKGNALQVSSNNGVNNSDRILGAIDEEYAEFYNDSDQLIIELDEELKAGDQITISWKSRNYNSNNNPSKLEVFESLDGSSFNLNSTLETEINEFFIHETITFSTNTKFLKLSNGSSIGNNTLDFDIDAISYSIRTCTPVGSIGDRVWEDTNGDGIQNNNEQGIEGVFVFLEDEFGNSIPDVQFQYTDTDGAYIFEDLPLGVYVVKFATPTGYRVTSQNKGDDLFDSDASVINGRSGLIELTESRNKELTIDAGYVKLVELIGIVWYDDEDGLWDELVEGVPDFKTTLYSVGDDKLACTDDDIKIGDTVTDNKGFYEFFDLYPGEYYVEFDSSTVPVGFEYTLYNIGLNDYIDSDVAPTGNKTDIFQLLSGQNRSGIDAGLVQSCDFIPSVIIGDTKCLDHPVDFEALPENPGYTYHWQFFDNEYNPVLIGESEDRVTTFSWGLPGSKLFKLTVSNETECSVSMIGKLTILPADDPACLNILPVEVISFNAELLENDRVLLNWATAWEQNNNLFEVERSTNGDRFEIIGSVQGNGTTEVLNNYHFLDETPVFGRNYYRLKQIDFDGNFEYTEVVSILLRDDELPDIIVYPNPTKHNTNLRVVNPFEEDGILEIVSPTGQILEVIIIEEGTNTKQVDLSKYQPGFYFLNIKYNGFKKLVHKVLKLRD